MKRQTKPRPPKPHVPGNAPLSTGSSKGLTSYCQVGKTSVPLKWTLPPALHRRLWSAALASTAGAQAARGSPPPHPAGVGLMEERKGQLGCKGAVRETRRPGHEPARLPLEASGPLHRLAHTASVLEWSDHERSLGPEGAHNLATRPVAWAASPAPAPSQRNI